MTTFGWRIVIGGGALCIAGLVLVGKASSQTPSGGNGLSLPSETSPGGNNSTNGTTLNPAPSDTVTPSGNTRSAVNNLGSGTTIPNNQHGEGTTTTPPSSRNSDFPSKLAPTGNAGTTTVNNTLSSSDDNASTTNNGGANHETVGTNPIDYSAVKEFEQKKPHHYLVLSQAIGQALDNNLDIQLKKLESGIELDRLTSAKGAFEPSFNFDGRYERLNTPQNAQEFTATGGTTFELNQLNGDPRIFHEENYRWRSSLEGKLPTGLTYEAFNQWDFLRNDLNEDSALSLFSPEYSTFTGITVTQPFLKDFGTDVNMAEIRVQRKNRFISDLDLRSTLITTVAAVMTNYLDLAYASENVRLRQEEVNLSIQLTDNRRDQLERGLSSIHDLNRAESAVSEAVEKLVEAENERVERQNALLRLITQDVDNADFSQIVPMTNFKATEFRPDRDRILQNAFTYRPDYLAAKERVDRDQIKIVYARNQTLPRIDFKSTVGINGLSNTPGNAFTRSFDPQGPQYSIGLLVNIPLGNEGADGKRDEAIKERQISITNLKMAEVDTVLQIDKALSAIHDNYKRIQAMHVFRQSADQSLEQEQTRLEKGLSTDMDVQRIHRDATEAKTRELAAIADYDKALVALFAAEGTLLSHQHILVGE